MSPERARRSAPTRISEPRTLNGLLVPPYVTLIHADHHGRVIKPVEEWGDDEDTEVLLIARDSDVAEMYRMKLEMDGYHVTRIDDLRDRTPSRAGWKPDLVMIDLGDAGAARLSELERLRSDPVLGSRPLLLLCTDTEAQLRRRGVTLRPTDYVLKVAQPGSLGGSIDEWSAIAFSSSAGPTASL